MNIKMKEKFQLKLIFPLNIKKEKKNMRKLN